MNKMKEGIIFDIKRYAINDGPGIRTTVFFKGCSLNCWWCHNPEGINPTIEKIKINKNSHDLKIKEYIGYKINTKNLLNEILKDILFYNESKGGVTFSGGEPLFQVEFLYSILVECKKHKINTAIDTSGFTELKNIKKICNYVDLFLYDLKFIDKNKHIKYTGKSNNKILTNLKYLDDINKKIQIRIPLIPSITDTNKNLNSIKEFIDTLNNISDICLLPYNKLFEYKIIKYNKYSKKKNYSSQSKTKLNTIKKYFKSEKYKVNIGG